MTAPYSMRWRDEFGGDYTETYDRLSDLVTRLVALNAEHVITEDQPATVTINESEVPRQHRAPVQLLKNLWPLQRKFNFDLTQL